MAVMMMGASHHNASVDFLECLAIEPARIQSVLQSICDLEEIDEAVLINTCNRKEVYISSRDPEGARAALRHTIACLSRQTGAELDVSLKTLEDEDAARHLFTVACGLDSMVVGEQQILGQVRDAMAASLDAGASGPVLNKLFRQAIHTGRTVRQHTAISEGAHSTVTVALDLAKRYLPKEGSRVLIYGAGMIGGMAARTLAGLENQPDLKPSEVHVANRTEWKAEEKTESTACAKSAKASPTPEPSPERRDNTRITVHAIEGADAGKTWTVEREGLIGRLPECDVVLTGPSVSRRHARLVLTDGVWRIEDLGSTNGIKVNGAATQGASLKEHDRVEVGGVTFTLTGV